MKSIKNLFFVLLAVSVVTGCGKSAYKKTPGGMPYQLFKGTGGDSIKAGNILKVSLTEKINDSVVYTTSGNLPLYLPVTPQPNPYDLSEVWQKIRVGDSVIATRMMDTFIKRNPQGVPPQFKKGDRIITYVKVLAVFANDSLAHADEDKGRQAKLAEEMQTIQKYLDDKKITATKTPSGTFVEVLTPGTGASVDSTSYVTVNYTGTTFDGKKFDSNEDSAFHHMEPYSFTIGSMVKGFDEAVKTMKVGSKIRAYIPSMLAYGPQPPTPAIKPYDNLIFTITLTDVKAKAPAPPAVPGGGQKVDAPQPNK